MSIGNHMKRVVGMGLVMLGAAAPAIAQEGMEPAPGQQKVTVETGNQAQPGQERQVTVTVKKVDPTNHKVTFEAQVKPEAGGEVQIDQLKPGQQVRATFDPSTGDIISIERLGPPPSGTSGSSGSSGSSDEMQH